LALLLQKGAELFVSFELVHHTLLIESGTKVAYKNASYNPDKCMQLAAFGQFLEVNIIIHVV
jgi:hypothetical protein